MWYMPDSEHPWREDLEILRKRQSPLYDQIGALASELNKTRDKNKALKGWIGALCTLTLLISVSWWTDHTGKTSTQNAPSEPSAASAEYDAKLSQVKSLAHTEGFREGYSAGKDDGYQTGYDAGMSDGVLESSEAYAEIANAWSDGYDSGYEQATADLETVAANAATSQPSHDSGYMAGYTDGYSAAGGEEDIETIYERGYEAGIEAGSSFDYDSAWQEGYDYGYRYGSSSSNTNTASSNTTPEPQAAETPASTVTTYDYVINTSTGKFHYSWCSSVGQMKESNKWYYTGTHDEVVNMGYVPCQRCCP